MAKIFNASIMLTGILLLLAFAGFSTMTHGLLTALGLITTTNAGQVTGISFGSGAILVGAACVAILSIFGMSSVSSGQVQIGSFAMNTTDSRLVAPFAILLTGYLMADLYSILQLADSSFAGETWIKPVLYLIVVPLMFGILIGMVQWWRGADI